MSKKKSPETTPEELYKFSDKYYVKKFRIQEGWDVFLNRLASAEGLWERVINASEVVEFLTWVEEVNKGDKKEEWKKIIDAWFNKYSNRDILYAFHKFAKSKKDKHSFEERLDWVKDNIDISIMWDNISKPVFGYYWNYLKLLKNESLKETVKRDSEEVREKIIDNLGTSPSVEEVLVEDLNIRENEIKLKVNELKKLDKLCADIMKSIEGKKKLLSSKKRLGSVKNEIQWLLSKLKDTYEKRMALIDELKKMIKKRNKNVEKLKLAIEANNLFPRAETETIKITYVELLDIVAKNKSFEEYIKEIENLFVDGQLFLDFWDK